MSTAVAGHAHMTPLIALLVALLWTTSCAVETAEPEGVEADGIEPDGIEPDGIEPDGVEPDAGVPDPPESDRTEDDDDPVDTREVAGAVLPCPADTTIGSDEPHALFGVVVAEPNIDHFETRQACRPMAVRRQFTSIKEELPTAGMMRDRESGRIPWITWKSRDLAIRGGEDMHWSRVIRGDFDENIRTSARNLKNAYGGWPVLLNFHHEAESDVGTLGSKAQYVEAFRHIVRIFRNVGVPNVRFTTAHTYGAYSNGDAADMYPGNDYVDLIGVNGFNKRLDCSPSPGCWWDGVGQMFDAARVFANNRGKPWAIGAYGSVEHPTDPTKKRDWFERSISVFKSWRSLRIVCYFSAAGENDRGIYHNYRVDSSDASLRGFRSLVLDAYFQETIVDGIW